MSKQHVNRVRDYMRAIEPKIQPVTMLEMIQRCSCSPEFAGFSAVVHTLDQWNRITSSAIAVFKIVQGHKCEFWAKVHYEEFAWTMPMDAPAGIPRTWLDDCARSGALRRAWPEEMQGLFLVEEVRMGEEICRGL